MVEPEGVVRSSGAHAPQQGRIEGVWSIGRAHHQHAVAGCHAVHLREEGCQQSICRSAVSTRPLPYAPCPHQGVDLIQEHNARRGFSGCGKHATQHPFRFAHVSRQHVRPRQGDEGGVHGSRERAHEGRLAVARWPKQQQTTRRRNTDRRVQGGVSEGQLNGLSQSGDDGCHATNVSPAVHASLHHHAPVPQRGGVYLQQRRVPIARLQRGRPSRRRCRCSTPAQRHHVSAHETDGSLGDARQRRGGSGGERRRRSVCSQQLQAGVRVWSAQAHLPIQSTRPSQGGIQRVGSVGGSDDNDSWPTPLVRRCSTLGSGAIQQRQELGDHAIHVPAGPSGCRNAATAARSTRQQRVHLVNEQDAHAGACTGGPSHLEQPAQSRLCLAYHGRQQLRASNRDEPHSGDSRRLSCHDTDQVRLAHTRRSIQQHACSRSPVEHVDHQKHAPRPRCPALDAPVGCGTRRAAYRPGCVKGSTHTSRSAASASS